MIPVERARLGRRPPRILASVAALIAALAAVAVPIAASAQASASGIVAGVVHDQTGAVLGGVEVSARLVDGSYLRRDVTTADGAFRLAALPPGAYEVTARRIGYRAVVVRGVAVSAASVATLTLRLVETAVTLAPVVVEESSAETANQTEVVPTRVTASEISALPVGTDLDRVIALAPGARPDQMWGGAGTEANAYRLDGVPIDQPGTGGPIIQPSVRWIQELDVRGLGAGAEEGGFQGGLVDIVTKSGTNTPLRRFSADFENAALDASNLSGTDTLPEIDGRVQLAAQASGPLIRDRLFYFVAAQWDQTDQRALDHLGTTRFSPVHEVASAPSAFGKLTWTPTVNDLVNVGLALGDSTVEHMGLTGLETSAATTRVRAPLALVDASWQHAFGSQTSVEGRVVGFTASDREEPYAGPDVPGIATYQLGTSQSYQNAQFTVRQRPTSLGYTITVDHFADWFGEHHLSAGVEDVFGGWTDDETRNAGMTWRPVYSTIDSSAATFNPSDPSTWEYPAVAWGGETHLHAHVRNSAVFVQDDIQMGRLGIHPGLREGFWSGTVDPYGGGAPIHALSASGLDPRLGLTFDLGSDARPLRLTVAWGRYHQDLFAQMFDRVQGANAYSNYQIAQYAQAPTFQSPTFVLSSAQRDSMLASGQLQLLESDQLDQSGPVSAYHQPYMDQIVLGLQADPTPHLHFSATFAARDYRDLIALVDKNAATDYVEQDSVVPVDNFGTPVVNYTGRTLILPKIYIPTNAILAAEADGLSVPGSLLKSNLTWNPQYEITNVPQARRRFRQVQLDADLRYPTWELSAALSFTSLTGNFSTVSGYDATARTGRDGPIGRGPGPYVWLNNQINDYGQLDNASPIEFQLRAIRDLVARMRGGLIITTESGDRLTPTFTLEPYVYRYYGYGDRLGNPMSGPQPDTDPAVLFVPLGGQSVNLAPLGSYHYAGYMTVDLHLERPVALGGAVLTVTVDAFNVLGSKAVTLVNTSIDADTDPNSLTRFASPLGFVQPRTLRLGMSGAW